MFVLGADREGLITPCGPPISIEIVAGATDLFEKEWPVGARIAGAVQTDAKQGTLAARAAPDLCCSSAGYKHREHLVSGTGVMDHCAGCDLNG
jgi:hypothetical protein